MDEEQRAAEVRRLRRPSQIDRALTRAGIGLPALKLGAEIARARYANPRAWVRALLADGLVSQTQQRAFVRELDRVGVERGIDPTFSVTIGIARHIGIEPRPLRTALAQALASEAAQARGFVCYAVADRERVRPIVERFRGEGFDLWMDEDGIDVGDEWEASIATAINRGGPILVFATHALLTRDYPKSEIARALQLDLQVLVVELDEGLDLSNVALKLPRLQSAKWYKDSERAYQKVVRALRKRRAAKR